MKRSNHKNSNAILDDAIADIRHEDIDPAIVSNAAERVWSRLAASERNHSVMAPAQLGATGVEATPAERIESCADFQTLIPLYMRKELSPARTLLVEDHVQECIPCRKALKESRSQKQAASIISATPMSIRGKGNSSHRTVWRWGIAAALVIGFGLALMTASRRILPFGEAFHATVHAANGPVYRITDAASSPVQVGDEILAGERVRAGKDADAVIRLADGSLIEMKERSELSVSDAARGVTINLERGNVIVEAAKHRARPLYVATNDCLVSVTGTIFSVNSGTKGSRVSVVEGEVHVARGGDEQVLRSGDQTTTSPSLEQVPLQEEIAWSRDAARYVRLAGELTALRRELDERMPRPGVRYASRLSEMVPDDTVLYAALPNMGASLSESYRVMQERINQNAALREWWASEHRSDSVHNDAELKRVFESVRRFSEHLGDEIVISAAINSEGRPEGPLVLAELRAPESFRLFLQEQVKTLAAEAKDAPALRFINDPSAVAQESAGKSAKSEIFVWINGDIFAAATNTRQLQQLAATVRDHGANRSATNSFHARIADIYREGAGIVVAADLEKIVAHALKGETRASGGNDSPRQIEALRQLGLLDLKHFIVEQKEVEGKTRSSAMLTFNERARGVASWLAAPGPMGALDFISPDANVVAAFVVKEPASLVSDLLSFIERATPD
ncbi:MAG: FecR domain-containing protein, partial [Acidobacteriota bacterium]|nr:FecR domain-containing protein [Acidobacteriota bacterium]